MALQQDQLALVQLLCEQGETYADIAALLGTEDDDVRDRARGVLAALGHEGDVDLPLTDFVFGQATATTEAAVVERLEDDGELRSRTSAVVARLRLLAPNADLPDIGAIAGGRELADPHEAPSPAGPLDPADRSDERRPRGGMTITWPSMRVIAGALGAGVILVVGVLALTGAFESAAGESDAVEAAAAAGEDASRVELDSVRGSGVFGTADLGVGDGGVFADLRLVGLDPALPEREGYLLWFMRNGDVGIPLPAQIEPLANGTFRQRVPIDAGIAVAIGDPATKLRIARSRLEVVAKKLTARAQGGSLRMISFEGESLAEGWLPILVADGADVPSQGGAGQGEGAGR